jgi:hypothetical protein
MSLLDLVGFRAPPLNCDPFEFPAMSGFPRAEAVQGVRDDYPMIARPGRQHLARPSAL